MNTELEKRASIDRPWLVPEATALLEKLIAEDKIRTVLEFGSGGSTVFFAEHVERVVSIEHNRRWYERAVERLKARNLKNAAVVLAKATKSSSHKVYRGRDGRYYRKYVKAGTGAARREFNRAVDCVLVDGRARVACVYAILKFVRPGGVLILDDSERKSYRAVETRLKQYHWKRVRTSWKAHQTDFWFRPQAQIDSAEETEGVKTEGENRGRYPL